MQLTWCACLEWRAATSPCDRWTRKAPSISNCSLLCYIFFINTLGMAMRRVKFMITIRWFLDRYGGMESSQGSELVQSSPCHSFKATSFELGTPYHYTNEHPLLFTDLYHQPATKSPAISFFHNNTQLISVAHLIQNLRSSSTFVGVFIRMGWRLGWSCLLMNTHLHTQSELSTRQNATWWLVGRAALFDRGTEAEEQDKERLIASKLSSCGFAW